MADQLPLGRTEQFPPRFVGTDDPLVIVDNEDRIAHVIEQGSVRERVEVIDAQLQARPGNCRPHQCQGGGRERELGRTDTEIAIADTRRVRQYGAADQHRDRPAMRRRNRRQSRDQRDDRITDQAVGKRGEYVAVPVVVRKA